MKETVRDVICLVLTILIAILIEFWDMIFPEDETKAPAEDPDTIVYISYSGGKIHDDPDCSGMIYYFEMEYGEAIDEGYIPCRNCY